MEERRQSRSDSPSIIKYAKGMEGRGAEKGNGSLLTSLLKRRSVAIVLSSALHQQSQDLGAKSWLARGSLILPGSHKLFRVA